MKKVLLILFLLFTSSAFAANGNKYMFYSKTFTASATTVTFEYEGTAFRAGKICLNNTSTTDSVWVDLDGNVAVADSASPTTNKTSIEIPKSTAWCTPKNHLPAGVPSISVIYAATKSGKVLVEAFE